MGKVHIEEGQIFAVPLSNGTYTIAQLINKHMIKPTMRKSENTFAFFDILFNDIKEAKIHVPTVDLSTPIAILTANSTPVAYGWTPIGKKDICILLEYKSLISSLGLFKNRSTDPSLFLEPYFGLFPWDGYAEDSWIEEKYLLPGTVIPKNIRFLKDFSIDELLKLLPHNSPKLLKIKDGLN